MLSQRYYAARVPADVPQKRSDRAIINRTRVDKAELDARTAELESTVPPGGSFMSRHVRQWLQQKLATTRNANRRARFLLHKLADISGYTTTMDFVPKKQSYRAVAGSLWSVAKESVTAFLNDNALSHGAAIAFYAATSLAPILLIIER